MKITANSILNLFFIFLPIPFIAHFMNWSPVVVFISSCLAIIPLAGLMGKATEYLADRVGSGWGGLLNATFGNACELIIALSALRAGYVDMVRASITGSIIGNILLVLGLSMIAGGLKHQTQTFNRTAATTSATLLALAAISLCVPAVFHHAAHRGAHVNELRLAIVISSIQFIVYILSLVFSLKTHKQLYVCAVDNEKDDAIGVSGWGVKKSIIVLAVCTIIVAILSEFLTHAVEEAAHTLGMTQLFIGTVLVAIVGNAAEHSTAVMMAMKNKMDLAMNIALGSGAQIALFVAPVIVFASFFLGHPMRLLFSEFELLSVVVSVIILGYVATDGECNWLEGVQLLAVYMILCSAFYFA
ncbi:MAG: calcium/proton exchanger [Leptolyngbya sp.]|nr:calcium/proton exchanger [Candidatus Melainabacteria bacterium]